MSPTPIDRMLSRALLVPDPDFLPCDVTDLFDTGFDETAAAIDAVDGIISEQSGGSEADPQSPAALLTQLCEAVVAQDAANLGEWVTEQLPDNAAARVLGCILHLADATYDARLWWQYAAGDDRAASHCLYLYHLARGENATAASWLGQYKPHPVPVPRLERAVSRTAGKLLAEDADTSLHTLLRVLRGLRSAGALGYGYEQTAAVLEFVPATLGTGHRRPADDIGLPLPSPYFADQFISLLAAVGGTRPRTPTTSMPSARRHPGAHLDSTLESEGIETTRTSALEVELRPPPACVSLP
ncbi:hypothetical protein ACIOC1_34045 [Streptomyces sp. NPDC088197]|uniref:hypothetical protein n=1 Tax=unclassified Streptomyces TaxID=2593676 RepID=UPI0036E57CB4